MALTAAQKKRLAGIKALVLDVDGVLTDGRIIYDSEGRETKNFDVKDGWGIVMLQKKGFRTAIISARDSRATDVRARDLKVSKVYQNAYPKVAAYEEMLKEFGLKDENVCFVGDDITDLDVLRRAGFAVAVKDAVPEAKKAAHYVTAKPGGKGAVREVAELILKSRGLWKEIVGGGQKK